MRKPYPSDLTDAQWAIIEPLIPVHATGRPRVNDMRWPAPHFLVQ